MNMHWFISKNDEYEMLGKFLINTNEMEIIFNLLQTSIIRFIKSVFL